MRWNKYRFPKPKPCVYCIYVDKALYYIGATTSIHNRLKAHLGKRGILNGIDKSRLSITYALTDEHLEVEELLIRRFRPQANVAMTNYGVRGIVLTKGKAACDYFKLR